MPAMRLIALDPTRPPLEVKLIVDVRRDVAREPVHQCGRNLYLFHPQLRFELCSDVPDRPDQVIGVRHISHEHRLHRRRLRRNDPIGLGLRGSSQQLVECLGWCHPAEGLSRAFVELGGDGVECCLVEGCEVAALGEVLAQEPVGVFVGAALPGAARVAEVDCVNLTLRGSNRDPSVRNLGQLGPRTTTRVQLGATTRPRRRS